MPIHPSIIDYYLQLLPGIPFSHARHRLLMLSTYDSSLKPLSQKILERPRLIERIRQALQIDKAFISCYNSTFWEAELSLKLNIPLYAAAPDLQIWGTKKVVVEKFLLKLVYIIQMVVSWSGMEKSWPGKWLSCGNVNHI